MRNFAKKTFSRNRISFFYETPHRFHFLQQNLFSRKSLQNTKKNFRKFCNFFRKFSFAGISTPCNLNLCIALKCMYLKKYQRLGIELKCMFRAQFFKASSLKKKVRSITFIVWVLERFEKNSLKKVKKMLKILFFFKNKY